MATDVPGSSISVNITKWQCLTGLLRFPRCLTWVKDHTWQEKRIFSMVSVKPQSEQSEVVPMNFPRRSMVWRFLGAELMLDGEGKLFREKGMAQRFPLQRAKEVASMSGCFCGLVIQAACSCIWWRYSYASWLEAVWWGGSKLRKSLPLEPYSSKVLLWREEDRSEKDISTGLRRSGSGVQMWPPICSRISRGNKLQLL